MAMDRQKTAGETDYSIYCWWFEVMTVLSFACLVIWLSLIPRNPSFTITNIYFPSLQAHNSSAGNASSVTIFDLQVFNPNKGMSIYHDGIDLSLYFNGVIVGRNSTWPFYQGHKNTTSWKIPMEMDAVSGRLFQHGLIISGGNLDYRVVVETSVKFRIFNWKTKKHQILGEAYLSSVKISPNGSFSGGNDIKLHKLLMPGSRA